MGFSAANCRDQPVGTTPVPGCCGGAGGHGRWRNLVSRTTKSFGGVVVVVSGVQRRDVGFGSPARANFSRGSSRWLRDHDGRATTAGPARTCSWPARRPLPRSKPASASTVSDVTDRPGEPSKFASVPSSSGLAVGPILSGCAFGEFIGVDDDLCARESSGIGHQGGGIHCDQSTSGSRPGEMSWAAKWIWKGTDPGSVPCWCPDPPEVGNVDRSLPLAADSR